jgi:hypothetical protein
MLRNDNQTSAVSARSISVGGLDRGSGGAIGTARSHPDLPILVVDLYDDPGRTFRVIPSEMWGVENKLSIANMGFEEFADAVDGDGIFRGFPQP